MALIDEVQKFAEEKHKWQVRRSGDRGIDHPIGVAKLLKEKGYNEDFQIVALLHDTLEDTDTSIYELEMLLGEDSPLVKAVVSLTKTEDMTLNESLMNAKNNPWGRVIKGADRLHNARTTYKDRNTQEFISGFILKTVVYYLPVLKEVSNVFLPELIVELKRLYSDLSIEAKAWVDENIKESQAENIFK